MNLLSACLLTMATVPYNLKQCMAHLVDKLACVKGTLDVKQPPPQSSVTKSRQLSLDALNCLYCLVLAASFTTRITIID